MAALYTITGTRPKIYIGNDGSPINGFEVRFTIEANGEGHMVDVPKLDPKTVDAAIKAVISQRMLLDKLGQG
jgi:hypothetical protein